MIALRVVAVTLLLGLSLAFQVAKGERVPTFYGLILFTYLATIIYTALLRHLQGDRPLTILAWSQVSIDLILETILVATTGGIESPFSVLYVITVAVASLVLRCRAGLVTASICTILLGGVTVVQLEGLLPVAAWLAPPRLTYAETMQTFSISGLAFLAVGFLSGMLADQLHQADQSLRRTAGAGSGDLL